MFRRIKRYLETLSKVDGTLEFRRLALLNIMATTSVIVSIGFLLVYIVQREYAAITTTFPPIIGAIGFKTLAKRSQIAATVFIFVFSNISILCSHYYFAGDLHINHFYFVMVVCSFVLFNVDQLKQISITALSSFFMGVISVVIPSPFEKSLQLDAHSIKLYNDIITVTSLFLVIFPAYILIVLNRYYHHKLVLSQNQELQNSKMAGLGLMAAGVAHEINNPLLVVRARAEMVGWYLSKQVPVDERHLEMITSIERNCDRISNIVGSLRTFSRNSQNDQKTRSNLISIVNESLDLFVEKLKSTNITINWQPTEATYIMCHPSEVMQVIVNLVGNAIDALTDCERPIKIIEVKINSTEEYVQLLIEDNGPGISVDIQDKIYQPFFSTKPIGKGTGLGLSIVKGIVDGHGGSLELFSRSGQTTFTISFPNAVAMEQRSAA